MKYATKLINLPPAHMKLLKKEAVRRGVPMNHVIRSAVVQFLAEIVLDLKK